jgi:hypothetical protein
MLAEAAEVAAPDGAEAPEAPTAAPVASSAGTVSTAPSRKRLGSCDINAFGFASNNAFAARASVPRSCDCVAAIARSLSDCPGRTVYWLPATSGAEAASGALAAASAAAAWAPLTPATPVRTKARAAAAAIWQTLLRDIA